AGAFGAPGAGGDTRSFTGRVSSGVRRGPEKLFRFDPAFPTISVRARPGGGPVGLEVDPDVVGGAGGRAEGGAGRRRYRGPGKERNAAGWSRFAVAGEPVFALVRRFVSRPARASAMGRCQTGALRR